MRAPTRPDHRRSVTAITGLVLALFAARTWMRVPDWSNNLRLFESALEVNPRSAKMLAWVGRGRLERNDLESARELLTRATELVPRWIDPRVHLARTLVFLDDLDAAEHELDLAAADAPSGDPWVPYHRGLIALRRERFEDAARQFAAATRPPWVAAARFNLGFARLRSGAPLDSAQTYLDAIERFPTDRRIDRELPRLREALTAVASSPEVAATCAEAAGWARGWLGILDEPGLLTDRIARGAPPRVAPCTSAASAP
jgi:tetratricopeptide (TPR) repeat protein